MDRQLPINPSFTILPLSLAEHKITGLVCKDATQKAQREEEVNPTAAECKQSQDTLRGGQGEQ